MNLDLTVPTKFGFNPPLVYGLDVANKTPRVANFHKATVHGCMEILGAMGLNPVDAIEPGLIYRRTGDLQITTLAELYQFMHPEQLLDDAEIPERYRKPWKEARSDRW